MLRLVLGTGLVLLSLTFGGSNLALADQTISIEGIVPPMRFMIVNHSGKITEIVSNTKQNIKPTVMLDSLSSGTQLSLTPQLLKDYQAKIEDISLADEVLHFNPNRPVASKPQSGGLFSLVSWLTLPFRR